MRSSSLCTPAEGAGSKHIEVNSQTVTVNVITGNQTQQGQVGATLLIAGLLHRVLQCTDKINTALKQYNTRNSTEQSGKHCDAPEGFKCL